MVIAIIAILAAILFPVFSKAREKARQTTCTSNQKQIATATMMYIQENEERLPGEDFWSVVDGASGKILICPTAGKKVARAYGYNAFIAGKGLGEIPVPEDVCLTADTVADLADGLLAFADDFDMRHAGGMISSYVDGHVVYGKSMPVLAVGTTSIVSEIPANATRGAQAYWSPAGTAQQQSDAEAAMLAAGFVANPTGVTPLMTNQEGFCWFYLGNNLVNQGHFAQDDTHLYTGSYIGIRGGTGPGYAAMDKVGLALEGGAESKGFIFSAEKAFSFIDYAESLNTAFTIAFLNSDNVVVASLSGLRTDSVNTMTLKSGSNSETMKSITANEHSVTQRGNYIVDVPAKPQFFQLDASGLSFIFYGGKLSCVAGGKSATINVGTGNYKKIDKVRFQVGDAARADSTKSCLVLFNPNFDQIL